MKIIFKKNFVKDLSKKPTTLKKQVKNLSDLIEKNKKLPENLDILAYQKKGKGYRRIRFGDWRIFVYIEGERSIEFLKITKRGDSYRAFFF